MIFSADDCHHVDCAQIVVCNAVQQKILVVDCFLKRNECHDVDLLLLKPVHAVSQDSVL